MVGLEKDILYLVSRVRCVTENQVGKVFSNKKRSNKKSLKRTLRKMCNDYTLRKFPCNITYTNFRDNSYVYYLNGSNVVREENLTKMLLGSEIAIRLRNSGFKFKLLKNSIVYHMHSATGNRVNGFKEYYLVRNLFMYTKRNQSLEKYKKAKKTYYIILIINLLKNFNMEVLKSVFKGIKDGNKEAKKIEYKEFN